MNNDVVITIASDINYTDYAYNLIDSINQHLTDVDIIYRCVDFHKNEREAVTTKYGADVKFIFDSPGFSNKKTILKDIGRSIHDRFDATAFGDVTMFRRVLYSERSVYTCHSRFKNILKCIDSGYKTIIALDCDTIVNRDFSDIYSYVNDHDLCVVGTKGANGSVELFKNEGLLMITNKGPANTYFKCVHDYIFNDNNYKQWNIDSIAMQSAYQANPINIGLLDDSYKDREFNIKSYMWSGDGVNKYTNKFNEDTSNMYR